MKYNCGIALTVVLLFVASSAGAQDEIPLNVRKLSEHAILVEPGQYAKLPHVAAIETERGIVVIDTSLFPSEAAAIRKKIVEYFGRDDFAYVINTHGHFDHTDGNQVFSDVNIIGHDNCRLQMMQFARQLDGFILNRQRLIEQQENRLKELDPNSPDALEIKERNAFNRLFLDELRASFKSTPPDISFDDRLTLDMGNITFKLIFYGNAHTHSDIVILIPEEKLVFYGDVMSKNLIQFGLDQNLDVERWLKVLAEIEALGPRMVIGGHAIDLEPKDITTWHRYINELWTDIESARKAGMTLAEAKASYQLEEKISLLDFIGEPNDFLRYQHNTNINLLWRKLQTSLALHLEQRIEETGIESAMKEARTIRESGNPDYYLDEAEFNALGYRFMQVQNINQAIQVFTFNTETFPQSWNVWDSLAEAYMLNNETENAVKYYKKSLELNPENDNAKHNVRNLEGKRLDEEKETREIFRYKPGESTGIRGPYLGQTPPGLEPKLFAPGIISTYKHFEFGCTFSPDGKELYFTRRADDGGINAILVSRLTESGWTAPETASFSGSDRYFDFEPHITPDGSRMFFGSNRPLPGTSELNMLADIWTMERAGAGWSQPQHHGPGMYVTTALDGTIYLFNLSQTGPSGVVSYTVHDGKKTDPVLLGGGVNQPAPAVHSTVSPDNQYIIFDSTRPGGQGGDGDFYICFRKKDGSWGEAINLGDTINTPGTNICPSLTPDGKYLFFTNYRDIYWVSTEVLERLRPDEN